MRPSVEIFTLCHHKIVIAYFCKTTKCRSLKQKTNATEKATTAVNGPGRAHSQLQHIAKKESLHTAGSLSITLSHTKCYFEHFLCNSEEYFEYKL